MQFGHGSQRKALVEHAILSPPYCRHEEMIGPASDEAIVRDECQEDRNLPRPHPSSSVR